MAAASALTVVLSASYSCAVLFQPTFLGVVGWVKAAIVTRAWAGAYQLQVLLQGLGLCAAALL